MSGSNNPTVPAVVCYWRRPSTVSSHRDSHRAYTGASWTGQTHMEGQ